MNTPASLAGSFERPTDNAPGAFKATVQANALQRLPSYPLHDYRLEWDVRDENNKIVASGAEVLRDLANLQTITGKLQPLADTSALRLHLTLLSPVGSIAVEDDIDWRRNEVGSQPAPTPVPAAMKDAAARTAPPQ